MCVDIVQHFICTVFITTGTIILLCTASIPIIARKPNGIYDFFIQ